MKKGLLFSMLIVTGINVTTTVFAADVNYDSNGKVEFTPNTEVTSPVNPLQPDPGNPVKPIDPTNPNGPNAGTGGALSIDYASSFDFGVNKISNQDEVYYARAQKYYGEQEAANLVTPNYVQVTDNRGKNTGWTLTVKQNGQFKNENTINRELTGAVISLTSAVAKSNSIDSRTPNVNQQVSLDASGSESIIMSAANKTGAGTWVNYWGEVEKIIEQDAKGAAISSEVTKAVTLSVPGSTPKDAVSYQTSLRWTLSDVPSI